MLRFVLTYASLLRKSDVNTLVCVRIRVGKVLTFAFPRPVSPIGFQSDAKGKER